MADFQMWLIRSQLRCRDERNSTTQKGRKSVGGASGYCLLKCFLHVTGSEFTESGSGPIGYLLKRYWALKSWWCARLSPYSNSRETPTDDMLEGEWINFFIVNFRVRDGDRFTYCWKIAASEKAPPELVIGFGCQWLTLDDQ